MRDQIIETIRQTLAVAANDITEATPIRAIAKDSMDVVELIAVLNSTYHVAVKPDQLAQVKTVGDVVAYVLRHRDTAPADGSLRAF